MLTLLSYTRAIAACVQDDFVEDPDKLCTNDGQGTTGEGKILKWLSSSGEGPPEVFEPPDAFQGVEDEDDTESLLNTELMDYMQKVTTSQAYEWLLSSIRCDLEFVLSGKVDAKRQIWALILNHPKLRHISRVVSLPAFEVTYSMTWDVMEFIKTQEYGMEPCEALWRALTLTGSMENAEGVACGDYICRTWPSTGAKFIQLVEMHINSDKSACQTGEPNPEKVDLHNFIRD